MTDNKIVDIKLKERVDHDDNHTSFTFSVVTEKDENEISNRN